MKTKYYVKDNPRVSISRTVPGIEALVSSKQPSHRTPQTGCPTAITQVNMFISLSRGYAGKKGLGIAALKGNKSRSFGSMRL